MSIPVGIVGVGQTTYARRHPEASSADLVWWAAEEALTDAGLSIEDVDAIVFGVAPDALAGENSVEKTAMFGVGKPTIRVNTGGVTGSSACFAGASYVAAGRARRVLVIALERMGQATTSQQVFNTIFDPVYEKDFPLTTITMAALRGSMLMRAYGYREYDWALIASRNYRNALRNPLAHLHLDVSPEDVLASPLLAWPIHRYEACPMSEGACAVVLAAEPSGEGAVAWIQGMASTSDAYAMGDRIRRPEATLVDLLSMRLSAKKAFAQAGVTMPRKEIDVIELYAPFSSAEAMVYPAFGLCAAEDGPAFVAEQFDGGAGLPVFNPSGGPQAANPVSATALVRIAECALQVRGRAGERQVPGTRRAVATGQGGATQFSTVCVLGTDRP